MMRVGKQATSSTVGLKPLNVYTYTTFVSHRLGELGQASHVYPKTFGTGAWRELVEECHPLISVVFLH